MVCGPSSHLVRQYSEAIHGALRCCRLLWRSSGHENMEEDMKEDMEEGMKKDIVEDMKKDMEEDEK